MKTGNNKSELTGFARYIRGEMSKREENAFQRKLQKDPFADEAEEGLSRISTDEALTDISMLQKRLGKRVSGSRKMVFYRIAASVAVLMIISSVFIIINRTRPVRELSKSEPVRVPAEVHMADASEEKGQKTIAGINTSGNPQIQPAESEETVSEELQPVRDETIMEEVIDRTVAEPAVMLAAEVPAVAAPPAASLREAAFTELRGTIISSEDNLPIPGAVVTMKGTNNIVITDTEGRFSMPLTDSASPVLVADFIGMETREFPVRKDADMKISMTPSEMALSEVVVVGYGKAAKGLETGAGDMEANKEAVYISAQPLNGKNEFENYIEGNIRNPASLPAGQRAVVVLSFLVRSTGIIDSIKIDRSPGQEFSDEAVRLIREGPEWKPAIENGKTINDKVRIRIAFNNNVDKEQLPE
ncbi:MAG: carboxypeptidase-like regulatory domain-containing protein [Bacteroidota bacterium]